MNRDEDASGSGDDLGRRLDGWKEIANHLGKGVRTVQRWEKVYGLPVRRIGDPGGEIVHAFTVQIDQWRTRSEGRLAGSGSAQQQHIPTDGTLAAGPRAAAESLLTSEAPARRASGRRWIAGVGGALVCVGVFGAWWALAWMNGDRAAGDSEPASVRFEGIELVASNRSGAELWRFSFPGLDPAAPLPPLNERPKLGEVVDLDGDGTHEVVAFRPPTAGQAVVRLYVLERDGRLRFAHAFDDTVSFGAGSWGPPFPVTRFLVTRNADRTASIWVVSQHQQEFPTVVEKLDPRGADQGRFWNPGHVRVLMEAVVAERRVILVGGTTNDVRAPVLAVLDYDRPEGAAPADDGGYRCASCPSGTPLAYLRFPRLPLASDFEQVSFVSEVLPNSGCYLKVTTSHGAFMASGEDQPPQVATAYYGFDDTLRLLSYELGTDYRAVHTWLAIQGKVPARHASRDEKMLTPVLSWQGDRFVPLATPPLPNTASR